MRFAGGWRPAAWLAPEDTPARAGEIKERFGNAVALLVDGVSKLDKLSFASEQQAHEIGIAFGVAIPDPVHGDIAGHRKKNPVDDRLQLAREFEHGDKLTVRRPHHQAIRMTRVRKVQSRPI